MPMVPFVPPPTPSVRAQDLGARIAQLIRDFQERDPDLSPGDVRQAIRFAAGQLDPQAAQTGRQPVLVALAAGAAVLAGALAFGVSGRLAHVPLLAAVAVGVAIVAVFVRLRSR